MSFPLRVNVIFIGYKGDGPFQYFLQTEKVIQGIKAALPQHTPFSLDSKSQLNIFMQLKCIIIILDSRKMLITAFPTLLQLTMILQNMNPI